MIRTEWALEMQICEEAALSDQRRERLLRASSAGGVAAGVGRKGHERSALIAADLMRSSSVADVKAVSPF